MKHTIYYLHAQSAVHMGTGQGTGVIDLPIAREKASYLPFAPGSGIKGVLRDELQGGSMANDPDMCAALFGPGPGEDASKHAGALAVGDTRLLALPVRSWKGTFAWVTCPMILRRYQRDLMQAKPTSAVSIPDKVPLMRGNAVWVSVDSEIVDRHKKIFLEDLDLEAEDGNAQKWAELISQFVFAGDEEWKNLFHKRFAIVADNIFDFLSETATEIRARIRIKEGTRTVQEGALWYEEYLPAETLMWGLVAADRAKKPEVVKDADSMLKLLPEYARLQIGGNASVGAGQVRWIKPEVA